MVQWDGGMRRRLGMTILWWILGISVAVVALKLVIVWAEPYMAFVPSRGATPPPPGFSSLDLTTHDAIRLTGWRTDIPPEGPVFLYFCGNAGNLSDRREMMMSGADAELAIVAFNYRGTGESQGRATEAGVYGDAEQIHDYVVKSLSVDPQRIVLWGHSIGGAVAVELASRRPVAGVVLEGTFRSGLVMAKRMLPFLPVAWFMTYKFDNEARIGRLQSPVLLIHGSQDFTIPATDSESLFDLAKGEKELWIVEGADHNNIYEVASDSFFSRLSHFGQRVAVSPSRIN